MKRSAVIAHMLKLCSPVLVIHNLLSNMENLQKVITKSNFVALNDVTPGWWNLLNEPVPEHMQCKKVPCSFAPIGHKKHGPMERNYSLGETRLIIQYLVHHGLIKFGKGLSVWETMISRGYLTHRSADSLNNHFKRKILPNIRDYNLPEDLEREFLELVPR